MLSTFKWRSSKIPTTNCRFLWEWKILCFINFSGILPTFELNLTVPHCVAATLLLLLLFCCLSLFSMPEVRHAPRFFGRPPNGPQQMAARIVGRKLQAGNIVIAKRCRKKKNEKRKKNESLKKTKKKEKCAAASRFLSWWRLPAALG